MFHVKHPIPRGSDSRMRFHVKHPSDDLRRRLSEQLVELGLYDRTASAHQDAMISYLLAILEVNGRVNVTAVTDPDEAVRLHVVDSLSALPEVDNAPAGELVDIGSGGGFPGVPLVLATGRAGVLLDSVSRKGQAVRDALDESGLGTLPITIESQRAEEYASAWPASASVVVARAVAPLPSLVELAAPLLIPGGFLVALKGRLEDSELAGGDSAAETVGLTRRSLRRLSLPVGGEERAIVAYERTGEPSIVLPRRVGRAQKRPLA